MRGNIALIARREIVTRLQQRGFVIGIAITLLIVVAVCVAPAFFDDDDSPTRYDVAVATSNPGLTKALQAAKDPSFTVHETSASEARAKVDKGDWDAAVLPGNRLLAEKSGDAVVGAVQRIWTNVSLVSNLRKAELSNAQISDALSVRPLTVSGTDSAEDGQRQAIALITVIVLFGQLISFCTWVAMGVVEEKASRVVEVILSAIRPLQLLTGKLLGIGILAAAQVLAIGVVALVAASAADTISIPASALVTVLVSFISFVLGYAFFAALSAALGSTVSRQEEVSGVLTPVTVALTLCYGASFVGTNDPDSTLSRVLSILPPVSSIAMPGRIARGDVPVLDIVLAAVLLAAAAAGMLAVAARIYRASVLHSGTRVPLKTAWRGEAVSELG